MLLGVLAWVALRHPAAPAEEWPDPRAYRPEGEVCEERREARQWTTYVVPDTPETVGGVTAADVARRFQLEVAPVCRANDLADPSACESTPLAPGTVVALPLGTDDGAIAAARAARSATGGSGGDA